MEDCVVVIRMKAGEEILAILVGELDNRVKIEHPYYVTVNAGSGNISMLPYCPLTDEYMFEINRSDINFLVTASEQVATRFISMVDATLSQPQLVGEDHTSDLISSDVTLANIIPCNTTKH